VEFANDAGIALRCAIKRFECQGMLLCHTRHKVKAT
jgi:hypothetical protein